MTMQTRNNLCLFATTVIADINEGGGTKSHVGTAVMSMNIEARICSSHNIVRYIQKTYAAIHAPNCAPVASLDDAFKSTQEKGLSYA
jgi:hypothetical protein